MSNKTLIQPSDAYSAAHERMRNRRIEEVFRLQEMIFNDTLRALILPACNVAELPTGLGAGVRGFVLDASVVTFNSVVLAGGANKVPVFFDGTAWRVG